MAFDTIGDPESGFLTTTQMARLLPFAVKRLFWTYGAPGGVVRGNHAHLATHELLVAVTGRVRVVAEVAPGQDEEYVLDAPSKGLHIPPLNWIRLYFDEGAVLLGMSSGDYDPLDYVQEYAEYCRLAYESSAAR